MTTATCAPATLEWGLEPPADSSESVARVSVRGTAPWVDPVVRRLRELVSLPVNWDPRGSRPMNADDLRDALDFLPRVMKDDTSVPWIGLLASGGLQLTWHSGDVEVEAIFDRARGEREILVSVGDNEWDAPVDHGHALFLTVRDRLTTDAVERDVIV